ncbi:reverse transcriptase family protein, partial [Salmonella enterica subsp. enterica serovar Give]|nr:reverse transcriptase family protein [Salmonella enterica subsp. enterica serovar Give]
MNYKVAAFRSYIWRAFTHCSSRSYFRKKKQHEQEPKWDDIRTYPYHRKTKETLFSALKIYGSTGKLLNSIESLYSRSLTAVRVDGVTGKWFDVNTGVRQGCKLSPLLFLIYMDKIVKDSKFIADVRVGEANISSLLYADDMVLISKSFHSLQCNLDQLTRTCEEYGMRINVEKSKSMVVGRKPVQTKCVVEGKELEQVPDFSYLGTVISGDGKLDGDLDNRICKAVKVCSQLYKAIFN